MVVLGVLALEINCFVDEAFVHFVEQLFDCFGFQLFEVLADFVYFVNSVQGRFIVLLLGLQNGNVDHGLSLIGRWACIAQFGAFLVYVYNVQGHVLVLWSWSRVGNAIYVSEAHLLITYDEIYHVTLDSECFAKLILSRSCACLASIKDGP